MLIILKAFVILNRKRPTISECLQHSWLAEEEEPPSPSPLMLKIPEPTFPPARHHSDAGHRHGSHMGGNGHHLGVPSRGPRSCQTCRKKLTERNRYLSKSREAIIEKATQSNFIQTPFKIKCDFCDRTFKSDIILRHHLAFKHSEAQIK